MKRKTGRIVVAAVLLATFSGQAAAWGGRHGGWNGGGWHGHRHHYRGPSTGVWIGAGAIAATGAFLAFNSRPRYVERTVTYVNPPVFYGPGVTYSAPVYAAPPVYVAPPVTYVAPPVQYAPTPQYVAPVQVAQSAPVESNVIAYPASGQNASQQSRDRVECDNWAKNYSGFDPAMVTPWTTSANTESYQRAVGACLKGRGYSIN